MSLPAYTLQDVTSYYANLLAIQFRGKPRATATIQILLKQAVADFMAAQIQEAFNLDTAVGNQLDVIAKYIGVSRNSNIPASVTFFTMADASGSGGGNGFNDVSAGSLNGFIYESASEADQPTTAFTDVQFLFVLKLQIALNHFDGTFRYIGNFLATYFPGQITVTDNLDMTLTYVVQPGLPISNTVLANFLPRPLGVGITITTAAASATRVTSDGYTRVTSDGFTRVTA